MIKDLKDHIRTNPFSLLVLAVVAAGIALLGWRYFSSSTGDVVVDVTVPTLTQTAKVGEEAFADSCAQCHGQNAGGSDKGPPLIHDIYNPGHHADGAFHLAVKTGVRSHHWRFGNMPPQPQVNDEDIAAIVRYVRELQAANGIEYRRHTM